ncbi:hypothetical protein [Paraliomyxa miuraensis]|uniref:hypothetical protein n=1 Tax=Paraliomyxa miuraensis TaxID=376150 RepID=UPI00224CA8A0|nr:hypothetical protein [Paraliomyxa miuraensis]MCX4242031.1 hypothetical protein [Paraliomyxa miuraensis]
MSLAAALGASLLTTGTSCTCSDRTTGDDPRGLTEPACLWLISPRGFRADGSSSLLQDDANHRNPTACLCITQEEYDALGDRLDRVGWPEEGTLLEEFNEVAYDECKRISELQGFVDDECLDYYQHGTWLKDIYFARGDWANGKPPEFSCHE